MVVSGLRKGMRKLAMLQVGAPIAESIGLNSGQLFMSCLCALAKPYKMPKCNPKGQSVS